MALPFYSIYAQTDVESSPMTSTVLGSEDMEMKDFVSDSKIKSLHGLIWEIE